MRGGYFVCNAAGDGVICPAVPGVPGAQEAVTGENIYVDDDECDGIINNTIVCNPGSNVPYYWNGNVSEAQLTPSPTNPCRAGVATCQADGRGYDPGPGLVIPHPEIPGNNNDEDCDGVVTP
jgi:hypothetical protein